MESLVELNMANNRLSGRLPDNTFVHLDRIMELKLDQNRDLSGDIHEDFQHMVQLRVLSIFSTDLAGQLFDFSGMTQLETLDAGGCEFSGGIPSSIGQTALVHLDLHSSNLEGPLPASMAGLTTLRTVRLGNNRLSGPLPAGLFENCASLLEIDLSHNRLEGSVTEMLSAVVTNSALQFAILNLEGNSFEGELPANVSRCHSIMLDDNIIAVHGGHNNPCLFCARCEKL